MSDTNVNDQKDQSNKTGFKALAAWIGKHNVACILTPAVAVIMAFGVDDSFHGAMTADNVASALESANQQIVNGAQTASAPVLERSRLPFKPYGTPVHVGDVNATLYDRKGDFFTAMVATVGNGNSTKVGAGTTFEKEVFYHNPTSGQVTRVPSGIANSLTN